MSAEFCTTQLRNLDYYNLSESTPPNSPWLSAEIRYEQPRKRKSTELTTKAWSKRRMGAEVIRRNPLKKTTGTPISVGENDDPEELASQPGYLPSDAVVSH